MNLPEDIDFTRASEIGDELRDLTPDVEGLRVELGGFLFAEFEQPSAELFGLAFAIIILIVAFGSVLAMGLPVGRRAVRHRVGRRVRRSWPATSSRSPTSRPSSA